VQVSENAPLRSFSHFPFRTLLTKSSDSVEEKGAPFTFILILDAHISTMDYFPKF
jgi:hypothetical protein